MVHIVSDLARKCGQPMRHRRKRAPDETWMAVVTALQRGARGLPGCSSLPKLLAKHRGVRNRGALPPFDTEKILAWADTHHERTGCWPKAQSGPIPETPGEIWMRVATALREGLRGLPGRSTLAELLVAKREVRHRLNRVSARLA